MGRSSSHRPRIHSRSTDANRVAWGATFRSHAQSFEDASLFKALKDVVAGYYVDIGAYEPFRDSVSAGFRERGWRGTSLDPLPGLAEQWEAVRPGDDFINSAITTHIGETDFVRRDGTGQSGIDVVGADIITVPCLTLHNLFDRLDKIIHWMKIDVEGHEAAVIQSWGDHRNRPWIICIEAGETAPVYEPSLIERGYSFVRHDGLNRFYLHKSQSHRREALATPPSIADDILITQWSGLSEMPAILESLQLETKSLKNLTDKQDRLIERQDKTIRDHLDAIEKGNTAQAFLHAHITSHTAAFEDRERELKQAVRDAEEGHWRATHPKVVQAEASQAERLQRRLDIADEAHAQALMALARRYEVERRGQTEAEDDLRRLREEKSNAVSEASQLDTQLKNLRMREQHLVEEIDRRQAAMDALLRSTSWRLTAPLRRVTNGVGGIAKAIRPKRTPSDAPPRERGTTSAKARLLDMLVLHWRRDYKLLRPLRGFLSRRPDLAKRLSVRSEGDMDELDRNDPFDPDPAETQVRLAKQQSKQPSGRSRLLDTRPRSVLLAPGAETDRFARAVKLRTRVRNPAE